MKVSDYISEYLAYKELSHVFGMSGANIEDLYTSIYKKNTTSIILAKNEYNATTMAIGCYLATRKISVVMTTSGPGVLNTIPVLAEAYTSKIPLVLISGIVPEAMEGLGAFQDTSGLGGTLNVLEMLKQCTCYQKKIQDEKSIPEALDKAFELAIKHKKPAVILIPKNIFNKEIEAFNSLAISPPEKIYEYTELSSAITFCQEFSIAEKTPPLIILGEELIHLNNTAFIQEFISKTAASVAVTPNSKGLFDHRNPQFLGLIGIMGHNEVNNYLNLTDFVILIGVNFDLLNRYGIQELMTSKKLLIIKEEKSSSLFCYSGETVCEIYGDLEDNITRISSTIKAAIPTRAPVAKNPAITEGFNFKNIINEIQSSIEDDANLFVDAGNTGAFVLHNLETRGNGTCYVSLGMGGMGNSIGAGIGGSVSSNKKSYVFLGDGSFLMYGLEIHTALEYNLPIVFFIFNNNSHGMCTTRENVFLDGETGINNFRESRYAEGIGKIFPGIISHEVNDLENLKQSLNDIVGRKSPCVVTINILNTEAPPFKTFFKN
ncbi:MAG: thiamine pyrophosphate-binding protein [Bacteriovorax sp.]|nr:thiamine pyrophosphate-binding protein [Bacteriovorax sp.]